MRIKQKSSPSKRKIFAWCSHYCEDIGESVWLEEVWEIGVWMSTTFPGWNYYYFKEEPSDSRIKWL